MKHDTYPAQEFGQNVELVRRAASSRSTRGAMRAVFMGLTAALVAAAFMSGAYSCHSHGNIDAHCHHFGVVTHVH